jgi:hypothetical protein
MRFLALGYVAAIAVTPTQKVIQLLQDMKSKGEREKHDETVQFATYKQWCEGTRADKEGQVKTGNEQINSLKASIAKNASDAKKLGQQIFEHERDIAMWEGDKKDSATVRENEHKTFEGMDQDLTESIDAVTMAREVLQKENYRRAQAEKGDSADRSIRSVLMQVSGTPLIDEESLKIINNYLQKGDDDEAHRAVQNPEAHGYSFQSQGIIDMLVKLKDKFDKQRTDTRNLERKNKESFEMLTANLNNEIDEATRQKSVKQQAKAAKLQKKGEEEGELQDTTDTRDDNVEFLGTMIATCEKKASDFEMRQQLRADEMVAIDKAVEILSSKAVSGNAEKHFPQDHSFLQLRSTHKLMHGMRQPKVIAYLMQQAQKLNSAALTALASRAEGDPLRKVKQMIKDLIVKLMEEATEEAEKQAWCEKELLENEHTRNQKTDKVELLSATIDQLETSTVKLAEDIQRLTESNQNMDQAVAKATAERQEEKAMNAVTVADAKEGQSAVAQAIEVLQEFYANASTATALVQRRGDTVQPEAPEIFDSPYKGQQGENTGIIGMLEVIQSDFARLEADTTNAEAEAVKAHTEFLNKTELLKAQQEKDIEHFTANRNDQLKLLADSKNDIIGTKKELDAANAYYQVLQGQCIAKSGNDYEGRAQARQEEIQSLQEALRILKGEEFE